MSRQAKIVLFIFPVLILLVTGILFFNNAFHFSSYKTQTILYRSKRDNNVRIEFQMQDVGALGYNNRTVKIEPGYLFDLTNEIGVDKINKADWIEVNEDINELNLKYP